MMFDTTPQILAFKRISTEKSHHKMAGVTYIQSLSLCCRCGKRRTTASGKFKKSGAFVCHSCGKASK